MCCPRLCAPHPRRKVLFVFPVEGQGHQCSTSSLCTLSVPLNGTGWEGHLCPAGCVKGPLQLQEPRKGGWGLVFSSWPQLGNPTSGHVRPVGPHIAIAEWGGQGQASQVEAVMSRKAP